MVYPAVNVMEAAEPMTYEPLPMVSPVGTEMVPVATLAKVFTPLKYGMLPMVAADDVESPLKPTAAPVNVIGQVAEMVACLPESVEAKSEPLRESEPKYAAVEEAYVEDMTVVEA